MRPEVGPRRWLQVLLSLAIAVVLAAGAPAAAQAPTQRPPEEAVAVTDPQALRALEQAIQYALFRYEVAGEERTGVPYRLGGKVTLEEFARLVREQPDQVEQVGIDASGLVINAYAAVIPEIRFFTGPTGQEGLARRVNSRTLFAFNSQPVSLQQARPGDLLFFRSPQTGEITGVAMVAERLPGVVRVVVASASRGRVAHVGIRTDGEYWRTHVAGLGRLLYAGAVPAATPATQR